MAKKWINIFRTGTHTDSSGRRRTWTEADLSRIASNYASRTEDAPIVFGHPKNDAPAEAWIEDVRVNGDKLQALPAQPSDKAREAVDTGAYKYGSLSLTPDLRIRHFGLLGAVPPAVKGLGRVEFEEEGGLTVDVNFNEPEELPADPPEDPAPEENDMNEAEWKAKLEAAEAQAKADREALEKAEAELKAKDAEFAEADAKRRKETLTARVDKLIADGKLLPAHKDKTLAFCEAMDGTADDPREMSFSEGEGKRPLVDHFLDFMAEAKGHELFQEFSAPAGDGQDAVTEDLTKYV